MYIIHPKKFFFVNHNEQHICKLRHITEQAQTVFAAKKNLYFGKTESWCYRVGTFLFFIVYLISPKTRFLSKKPVYD